MVQDVVADAMTVEAVPRVDDQGQPLASAALKLMHTTMQTLGRVAIIGGSVAVALANVTLFSGVEQMSGADKIAVYIRIYEYALAIPVVSVLGVMLAGWLKMRHRARCARRATAGARRSKWRVVRTSGRSRTGGFWAAAWPSSCSR